MNRDFQEYDLRQKFNSIKDFDESIHWTGTPKFIPFLATGIPFLIFGCIWGAIDIFGFILPMRSATAGGFGIPLGFVVPFFALHMFPFYGSILNIIRLALVYRNTIYAITSKRLIIRTGFMGIDYKSVDYDRIVDIEVNINPLEKIFNVGSIYVFSGDLVSTRNGTRRANKNFRAIEDPYDVYRKIKQITVDVKTDWNYPNNLRPRENPGYNTKYEPRE